MYLIQVALDVLSSKYENIIIIADFNLEPKESAMIDFCQAYNMKKLILKFTCYKNPNKPTGIDVMLTNKPRFFKKSSVLETGFLFSQDHIYSHEGLFCKTNSKNCILLRLQKDF